MEKHSVCYHNGKFHQIPKVFKFPENLRQDTTWKLWLAGQPNYKVVVDDSSTKLDLIRPYLFFDTKLLPLEVKNKFKLKFKPILGLMEKSPGLDLQNNVSEMNAKFFETNYDIAIPYLKDQVSYNPK